MLAHLDCFGRLQGLLWRDSHLPLPQKLLGEVGDVTPGDGDVLYTAANHVALRLATRQKDESMEIKNREGFVKIQLDFFPRLNNF